jgi:phosphohistidine phosphatase
MHSGKTRARQSAEILAATLAPGVAVEAISGIDPLDDPEPLARQLMTWSDDAIIVGHLPFLGKLVSSLVAGDPGANLVSFLPGSVVCLERSDDSWTIIWMVWPELLNPSSE